MRSLPLFVFLILAASTTLAAEPIEQGQSSEQVITALGKPIGTIELREKTLLLYPQGEITLKEDRVVEIDLMDAEQFAADQAQLKLERAEWLADQERRRAAQTKEGEAIRAQKITSRAFNALPAKDKVSYWRSFQTRYAEVDVSEQIAAAYASYESELEALRNQQRIAELEARVAQAEKEAAAARLETEALRQETERQKSSQYYGLRYSTTPVINNSRYYYRPPTVTIYTNNDGTTTTRRHQKSTARPDGAYRSFDTQN